MLQKVLAAFYVCIQPQHLTSERTFWPSPPALEGAQALKATRATRCGGCLGRRPHHEMVGFPVRWQPCRVANIVTRPTNGALGQGRNPCHFLVGHVVKCPLVPWRLPRRLFPAIKSPQKRSRGQTAGSAATARSPDSWTFQAAQVRCVVRRLPLPPALSVSGSSSTCRVGGTGLPPGSHINIVDLGSHWSGWAALSILPPSILPQHNSQPFRHALPILPKAESPRGGREIEL